MATRYYCDRCGRRMRLEDVRKVTVTRVGAASKVSYDLCHTCAARVQKALRDALLEEAEDE